MRWRGAPAVVALLLLADCSSTARPVAKKTTPAAKVKPPARIRASGMVSIPGRETITNGGPSTECWAIGNDPLADTLGGEKSTFVDVKAGAQIVVADADGRTVGVGTLADGVASSESDGVTSGNKRYPCTFAFDAGMVPTSSAFYKITVGAHSVQVSRTEIGVVDAKLS